MQGGAGHAPCERLALGMGLGGWVLQALTTRVTVIIAKERGELALHCLAADAQESTNFVLLAPSHCPL